MSTEENNVIDPTLIVTTDQTDYAPDSTARITAESVAVGGTVEFVVTDPDLSDGVVVSGTNEPWTVTDGSADDLNGAVDGTIVTTWNVNQDAADQACVLTATDTTSSEVATAEFTDAKPLPVPVPPVPVGNVNGLLIDAVSVSEAAGTGLFASFRQLHGDNQDADPESTNYNDDGAASTEEAFNVFNPPELDSGSDAPHNHTIKYGDIPKEVIGSTTYLVFRLHLNEPNSGDSPKISLDALKVYSSGSGTLSSFVDLNGATLLFDMDGGGGGSVDL